MKRMSIFLCAVAILLMGCSNNGSQTEGNNAASSSEKVSEAGKNSQSVPAGYVDLGLSVYWKDCNEASSEDDHGFYTYDEAVKKFGSSLPTREQFEELEKKCTWTWSDSKKGYDVKGPNGNSIFLPAVGGRDCNGDVHSVGTYGYYLMSYPDYSEFIYQLCISSSEVNVFGDQNVLDGRSVRLVQSK